MDLEKRIALRGLASLPYWWNKTRELGVPQPKTVYAPYEERTLRRSLDGEKLDIAPLLEAAETVGGYPVFLRTDQMSGKHSWDRTCYVESADVMYRHVMALVEENYMADMVGEALPSGFAVREFLDLDWSFRAFGGNMPIATEARTFLRNGEIECIHPYWPPESIEEWAARVNRFMHVPDDWRDALEHQYAKIERDMDTIRAVVLKVAAVMDGWWSCDVALGRNGMWYLIDMAPGAASYHWSSCKYAPMD